MNILLGTTGSVAAILTPKIVSALIYSGHNVKVATTSSSLFFWDKDQVSVDVYTDQDEWVAGKYTSGESVLHIELRKWADMLVVAPLSANTLAKFAYGLSDNLLTCVLRAWDREKKVVIAPAMNTFMWEHPLTDKHIFMVNEIYKLTVVNPIRKTLACGDTGLGALADIEDIVSACC